MHTVAGCFTSQEEALGAIHDLEKQGVSPVTIKVIESDDSKGFEREHRSTVSAATRGAGVGLIFGLAVFGILFGIAGASLFDLRHLALFLSAVALSVVGWAFVLACWNMGISHDEALLYEEAKQTREVIAAVEVSEPMKERVIRELERHGALRIRSGNWQPLGWRHTHPSYDAMG